MYCRHCATPMQLLRRELGRFSEQDLLLCPRCERRSLHTRPLALDERLATPTGHWTATGAPAHAAR
jgi:hypothetical protein